MTTEEKDQIRRRLEVELASIESDMRRKDRLHVERSAEATDHVQSAALREVDVRYMEREASRRRLIRAALRRVEEGSYGECERCGEEISRKRLDVMPWAPLCRHCQQAADHHQEGWTYVPSEVFLAA